MNYKNLTVNSYNTIEYLWSIAYDIIGEGIDFNDIKVVINNYDYEIIVISTNEIIAKGKVL